MHIIARISLFLLLVISTTTTARASDPPVIIHGSTTFASRLMETHRQEIESRSGQITSVLPNKSINGLLALIEGRADLAMISAPLESELILLRRRDPAASFDQLTSFEVSRTSVAFVIHPDNPIKSIRLDDIRRILTGQLRNWRDIGGHDAIIKPVFVKEGGGVTLAVQAQLLAGQPISANSAVRIETPRQVLKVVAQEPGALGITQQQLAHASGLLRLETDGTIEQTLNLVSLGPPSPRSMRVIEAARAVAAERLF